MDNPNEPLIPVEGVWKSIEELSGTATNPKSISLADANARYGFVHCFRCGVGGHTGVPLYTVIKNVVTGEEDKACGKHVGEYVRPRDLKKKRK